MNINMEFMWFLVIISCAVIEGFTTQLVGIWFAIGAVVPLVLSRFNVSIFWQIISFLVISSVLLIITKPIIKKFVKPKYQSTNADSLIGKKAVITTDINNLESQGEVKINGLLWSARSEDDTLIKKDEIVTVKSIEGVKLIVKK